MPIPGQPAQISGPSTSEFARFFTGSYLRALSWLWYKIMLGVMLVVTIVCAFIPLLNILAYEFAAVIGLIVSHFTAILVIREINLIREGLSHRGPVSEGPHSRLVVWGVILGAVAAVGWLMLIPLAGMVILDLILSIRNCDPLTGFIFFMTIPVISSFFAGAVAVFCSLVTPNRSRAGWLYFAILLVFFVRMLLRFGVGHTIGLHDPFIGTLNLPLYSQEANPDFGFLYSRLFVLIFSVFLVNLSVLFACGKFQYYGFRNLFGNFRKFDTFMPELQTLMMTGVILIVGLCNMGPLGIEITRNYLEHKLDGEIVTEHFIIRYPTGGEVEEDIERVAENHEFYYWSIYNEIQTAPDGLIRAYIYPDRDTKTFLTGVGSSVYAKPWTGEIHVEYSRNNIRALKHELVHVISAPMGVPFFGSSLLVGYGEGIAEGLEWNTGNNLTYHTWTAALREADDPYYDGPFFPRDTAPDKLFPENASGLSLLLSNFNQGGFYEGRITMNYYVSASHTKWFIDTYGIDAYKTAYIANDTVRAAGINSTEATRLWMDYLDHVPLKNGEIEFARLAFAPRKFTVRVCAHETAEHERLAGEFIRRRDWDSAYGEYSILLDFSPENIRYAYQQIRMLYFDERYDAALRGIAVVREWPSSEGWETYLLLLEGDIYARSGQLVMALEAYEEAYDEALATDHRETSEMRIAVLESPALDEFLAAYREENNARWRYERARAIDDGWLPIYNVAGSLIGDRLYEEAQELYLECLALDPEFQFVKRNCLYNLGVCAYRAGEYSLAGENFLEAYNIAESLYVESHPSWDRVIPLDRLDVWAASVSDWIKRCEWRQDWPGI